MIGLIVVVVVGVYIAWQVSGPDAEVDVIAPRRETIRVYVNERAVTELPHDYLISMPISGWLQRLDLREGDRVKAGQVVARLDTHDLSSRMGQVEQRIAVLTSRISKTSDNRLEENSLIEANATVKALDETVEAAKSNVKASKAVADFARYEVDRLKKLGEAGATADREVRQSEMIYRKAWAEYQSDSFELAAMKTIAAVSHIGPKFIMDYIDLKSYDREQYRRQLDEARAELEIAKRNLARAKIESPIDGVVLARYQTRRQFLPAGTVLLTIGRLDDMEVIAEVLTERATRISPGDPVDIFGKAIPNGPVAGKVWRVYPAGFKKISSLGVEQQRVNVAIKLDDRPMRLGVAFRVHVRIYYDQADDTLTLPRTALFRGAKGGWQVMIVRDGKTELQPVEVGLTNDDRAQILVGLNLDDQIVAKPSGDITAGMKVEVRTAD